MRSLFIAMIVLPQLCMGQDNLVPNESFETYSECPWGISQIEKAIPWTNVGGPGTPDYYHRCAPPLIFPPDTVPHIGVPENARGVQEPYFGDGYAGIYVYNGPVLETVREYIQVELQQAIVAGVRYELSFHVSLADNFQYAIGSFGAYFSPHRMVANSWNSLAVNPQIESPVGIIYNGKDDWTEVRDTFNSRYGGEKWLIIGNFLPDSLSSVSFVDSEAIFDQSYYYLDDVSVIALDSIPNNIEETERLSLSVFPNPATDVIHIEGAEQLRHLRLADLRGREVMTEEVSGHHHSLKIGHLPAGLYILEVTATDGRRATHRVIKMAGP